jgi:hypothetical protein
MSAVARPDEALVNGRDSNHVSDGPDKMAHSNSLFFTSGLSKTTTPGLRRETVEGICYPGVTMLVETARNEQQSNRPILSRFSE